VPGGGIKVTGLAKLARDLVALGVEVEDLKSAFGDIADQGARIVSLFTPVGPTGNLRASIRGNRARSSAVVAAGRASVPYAGPINYGWPKRNITGAGFMQKADGAWQHAALQRLEQDINRQIQRRGLK
jgi:hypothetical protein